MELSQRVPSRGQTKTLKELDDKDLKKVDDAKKKFNYDPLANS